MSSTKNKVFELVINQKKATTTRVERYFGAINWISWPSASVFTPPHLVTAAARLYFCKSISILSSSNRVRIGKNISKSELP